MLALISCITLLGQSPTELPVEAKYIEGIIPIAVHARVGGTERRVMLSTTRRTSYVPGTGGSELEISLNGRVLAKVATGREVPKIGSLEAVLGLDVLKDMAVGLDLMNGRVTLWPKGGLGHDLAKMWVGAYAAPDGEVRPEVKILSPERLDGAMILPVGDAGNRALFHLGKTGTVIGEGGPAVAGSVVKDAPQRLSTGMPIAGRETPWLSFLYGRDAGWAEFPKAAGMSVTAEAFRSRRVLVDFPASKIYIEELSPDAKLSWTLTEWFRAPYRVKGDRILLDGLPGMPWQLPGNERLRGSTVQALAGLPSAEFLSLLRSPTAVSRNRLAEVFSMRLAYTAEIQTPSGESLTLDMKLPGSGR